MTTVFITYPGDEHTRFDRQYYVSAHLPLVMKSWGPHGLQTTAAFFPSGDGAGTIAACICHFRDDAAVKAAFSSPETERVMSDVKRFTDAKPAQWSAVSLQG